MGNSLIMLFPEGEIYLLELAGGRKCGALQLPRSVVAFSGRAPTSVARKSLFGKSFACRGVTNKPN